MNIRWFLALTLGCLVCLEWTLCEAVAKTGRSSSGLVEHPADCRGRKPAGRGRKLKLTHKNEEEPHGKRPSRHTSCSGKSKDQSSRRKKCVCPPCEKCPVCPVCNSVDSVQRDIPFVALDQTLGSTNDKKCVCPSCEKCPVCPVCNTLDSVQNHIPFVAMTMAQTTETTPSTIPSTTTTSTTPSTTTTSTTPATTTTRTTTRRTTTKTPLGRLFQTFGSLGGNGFGAASRGQDKPTGGGLMGGISFPNPFKNIIKMFSRISDLRKKMKNGVPNPFCAKTTKPATKCSKKPDSKSDTVFVAISDPSSQKSDSKQVACSKVIELKHPGKIYICME